MKTETKMLGIGMTERNVPKVMDGSKTQTRRIESVLRKIESSKAAKYFDDAKPVFWRFLWNGNTHDVYPRHQVGDRLYVKEALEQYNVHKSRPVFAVYKTDKAHVWTPDRDFRRWQSDTGKPWKNKVIPARYMPRSAARTFIEITDVRCERIQDISVEDIKAEGIAIKEGGNCAQCGNVLALEMSGDNEGVSFLTCGGDPCLNTITDVDDLADVYMRSFRLLWNDTNGKDAWERNDWVFAYTFKLIGVERLN